MLLGAVELLALLRPLQAGIPTMDFSPLSGRGRRIYVAGIHAAMGRDYAPLAAIFGRVIERLFASAERRLADARFRLGGGRHVVQSSPRSLYEDRHPCHP